MTLPYVTRLLCISLATLFLVHLTLGLLVSLAAGFAVRYVERMQPRLAARCLLILRLLPAAGAAFVVIVACLPSYLWLEPDIPAERVSLGCILVALLAIGMWSLSLARGVHAAADSRRFLLGCRRGGRRMLLAGDDSEAWIVDGLPPLVALGGILRPRVVISRGVVKALSSEQLAAAFRHERAHWASHDNLKRLLVLLTPAVLPFASSSRTLERSWKKFAEWAADDRAVAGNARRSFALAGALVKVARLTSAMPQPQLILPLMGDADELAARVNRLLGAPDLPCSAARPKRLMAFSALLLLAASITLAILLPDTLYSVHLALERLVE